MTRSTRQILLAIDSSTRSAGLALYDGAEVLVESTWTSLDHHTTELAPAVANAFAKSGITFSELAALAVARGPGSFTGLRIGFALAKGLAMSRHIPLVAIPTLDFLAAAQPAQDIPMLAVLRAGRGRLAAAWYSCTELGWQPDGAPEVLTVGDIMQRLRMKTYVCGELSSEERYSLNHDCPLARLATPAHSLRRTAFLAELAWTRWQAGKTDDPAVTGPLYLHYNQPIPA